MLAVSFLMLTACEKTAKAHNSQPTEVQSEATAPTPFMRLKALRTPVKSFTQWAIAEEMLADNPTLNPADAADVRRAIDAGELDEMSVPMPTYSFDAADWTLEAPLKGTITEMLPGQFDIEYKDGFPITFTLDQADFQDRVDNGFMMLDAYEVGLERFAIDYNSDGMPEGLRGKCMDFFGGRDYQVRYSDYVYDEKGNWTRRTKTTPYVTQIEFRAYEY